MAKVFLTSSSIKDEPEVPPLREYHRMVECWRRDKFSVHERTDRPEDADVIIFAELADMVGGVIDRIQNHPVYKAFPDRCVHYNPRFKDVPIIPGIYASASRRWCMAGHAVTSHYLETAIESEDLNDLVPPATPPFLFSFCGSSDTWKGRRRLFQFVDSNAYLYDTAGERQALLRGEEAAYRQRFVQSLHESLFVLCPRGVGPASLRLFEVLKAGRAPVIIADDYTPPEGPDWGSFSVSIRERDIDKIPEVLDRLAPRAAEMGRLARRAHEEWFADDVSFHRIVEWSLDLLGDRDRPAVRRHRRRLAVEASVRDAVRTAKRSVTRLL